MWLKLECLFEKLARKHFKKRESKWKWDCLRISEQTSSLLDHPCYGQSQKLFVFFALCKISEYLQLDPCIGVAVNADSLHDFEHPVKIPVIIIKLTLVWSFRLAPRKCKSNLSCWFGFWMDRFADAPPILLRTEQTWKIWYMVNYCS